MTTTLAYRDRIAVLTVGDDDNRLHPDRIGTVNELLDDVQVNAAALITTGTAKFFSNGLDVEWLSANPERVGWYLAQVHGLYHRLLTFPLPTAAAVNGHAFGAGAMLALSHDLRVMRADRGYFCLPEVDIGMPFTAGMVALLQAKLLPQTALIAMTTGRRYGGADALAAGIVDDTAAEDALLDAAEAMLAPLTGKDPATLGAIKAGIYASATAALTDPGAAPA